MTARFSTTYSSTRCTMAAACSSARISPILDTAMILAVSICVVAWTRLILAVSICVTGASGSSGVTASHGEGEFTPWANRFFSKK